MWAIISLILLFTSGTAGNRLFEGNSEPAGDSPDPLSVSVTPNSIYIKYTIPGYEFKNWPAEGNDYFRISIPGHIPTSIPGKPELPVLSRLIVVPDGSEPVITITNVKTGRLKPSREKVSGLLYPVQEGETKDPQQSRRKFTIDEELYSRRTVIRTDTVKIEYIGKLRDKSLANLVISPVRYNPGKNHLEVIESMDIEVSFSGGRSKGTGRVETAAFNEVLSKGVLNYTQDDLIPGFTDKPVRMLILTDTSFTKHLQPFIRWKTQKGFKLQVLYRGLNHAGLTSTELKSSIEEIWDGATEENPPPDYLLIIGDVSKIPYYGTGQVTDMYYGEFDGNGDYIPELFIGRLPVSDTTELKNTLAKLLQYEKFEFAPTNNYYSNALTTTGYDASYASYLNGQVKYGISYYLNASNKINEYHFYYPQPSQVAHKDSVIKLINKGLGFINYSGHGSSTAWLHLNIAVSDTAKFLNIDKYPFIISNACLTSRFNTSSLGNELVTAKSKGAIGYIGCSNDSYWDEDFYWFVGLGTPSADPKYETTGLGAFDRLFHTHGEKASDWYITMGQVNFAGNMAVSTSTSQRKKYYWETYNLVGDPSIIPFMGTPDTFDISLPDTLPRTLRSLSLVTQPYSYIAISDFKNLWDASHVSPSGSVILDLPDHSKDSCLVVVTGQNRVPLQKTIYFGDIDNEFINLSKTEVNDSGGNNNGLADFGETISLKLTISNLGQTAASALYAKAETTSEWVTAISDSAYIGTLPAEGEIVLTDQLKFRISDNVPDKGIITFSIKLKDIVSEKNFVTDVTAHSPVVYIMNCLPDDILTGNGNYIADPGETINMVFQIMNTGSSNTSGQFTIFTSNTDLTLPEPSVKSGTLEFGKITEIVLPVKISEEALTGSSFTLNSVLECSTLSDSREFTFRIGRIRESFESETFKVFPWINISPKPWTILSSAVADGSFSARSGAISHNTTSSLIIRTRYAANDSIRFWYKVSSENNYDFFIFKLNDKEIFKKSGETDWLKRAVPVPAGYNKMEWIYKKDQSVSSGSDCAMIDMIDFSDAASVSYISTDLVSARLVSPAQTDDPGKETVTVKLLNNGPDTITTFNLAYRINKNSPVEEKFTAVLIPFGDSVSVSFKTKADLSRYGIYDLLVYNTANNDDYVHNDTLAIRIENTVIDEPLAVFPNPFTDELRIVINTENEGKSRIRISDQSGRIVIDEQGIVSKGDNLIVFSGKRFSRGIYYIKVEAPGLFRTIPVIKSGD